MRSDEVIDILKIEPEKDRFELDEEVHSLAFPCCVCLYRTGADTEEPCSFCGNNANCKI